MLETATAEVARNDANDIGSVLDEIIQSPPAPSLDQSLGSSPTGAQQDTSEAVQFGSRQARPRLPAGPEISLGALTLSDYSGPSLTRPQPSHYDEEMDWSPSASQHRAFSSYNPYRARNPNPKFNEAPVEDAPGAFWYRVPPAPSNPARMRYNPPARPAIMESPKEKTENFFTGNDRGPVTIGSRTPKDTSGITLKDPTFYAPAQADDPRDSLSRMFAGSLSISPDPEDEAAARRNRRNRDLLADRPGMELPNRSGARLVELVLLFAALWSWVTALSTEELYSSTLASIAVGTCLIVSVRLAADMFVDDRIMQMERAKQNRLVSVLSLSTLGLAQVVANLALGWRVWLGSGNSIDNGAYGNALFGVIIVHQLWHVFG